MKSVGILDGHECFEFPRQADDALLLCPLDLRSLRESDEFHDVCGALGPQFVVFAGLGSYVSDVPPTAPTVNPCLKAWWSNVVEEKGRPRRVSEDYEEVGRNRRATIDSYAREADWKDLYRVDFDHNDEPDFRWGDAFLIQDGFDEQIPDVISSRPDLAVIERRARGYPRLRQFRESRATMMYAPAACWNADPAERAAGDSSIDALLALVNHIAVREAASVLSRSRVGRAGGTPAAPLNSATVTFSGNALRRRATELRAISQHLPLQSVEIVRRTKGSVILDVRGDDVDLSILAGLLNSGVYQYLAADVRGRGDPADFQDVTLRRPLGPQPLIIADFLDDLDELGRGATGRSSSLNLRSFASRWSGVPQLRPMVKLISESGELDSAFSRCG